MSSYNPHMRKWVPRDRHMRFHRCRQAAEPDDRTVNIEVLRSAFEVRAYVLCIFGSDRIAFSVDITQCDLAKVWQELGAFAAWSVRLAGKVRMGRLRQAISDLNDGHELTVQRRGFVTAKSSDDLANQELLNVTF